MKHTPTKNNSLDLIKWAYLESKPEFKTEWYEQIAIIDNADTLLNLAQDEQCPRREYILKYLYYLVGTSASRHVVSDIAKIKKLLETVESTSDQLILNWVQRSRAILQDLRKYDYIEWCQGGFVEKDLPGIQQKS